LQESEWTRDEFGFTGNGISAWLGGGMTDVGGAHKKVFPGAAFSR
jgi:hypothetical protein